MNHVSDSAAVPPQVTLVQMMTGYWVSQSVYIAAKLGIADVLQASPRHYEELADATQVHAPSLYRLLRALAGVGVFSECADGTFELTPTAALLQTGSPQSLRALAIMLGEELYRVWGAMLTSVTTGEKTFDRVFGMGYVPYLVQEPAAYETFMQAMTRLSALIDRAVLAAYDFSAFGTVVDVAGRHGRRLAAILQAYPRLRGVLFDQPHFVAQAGRCLQEAGVHDRCQTIAGDIFAEVPGGGDAYLLAQTVHDWDDERGLLILQTCRRAMGPTSTLLIVDRVIAPANVPDPGKFLDLHMLALLGGRERTEAEFRGLLAAAGFTLSRMLPTQAAERIIEAKPL